MRSLFANGLPPAVVPPQKGDPKYKPIRDYIAFLVKHQTIPKVKWCCGPECCQELLNAIKDQTKRVEIKYHEDCQKHLTICLKMFQHGLGKLNCMQTELGETLTDGKPFSIDKTLITVHGAKTLQEEKLKHYIELYNTKRGLQADRFNKRSTFEQFLSIRSTALTDPENRLSGYWPPSPQLLHEFHDLQTDYGKGSAQASEVALNWESVREVVPILEKLGGAILIVVPRRHKLPPAIPTAALPPPLTPDNRPRPDLETSIEVEEAILKVIEAASTLKDLPGKFHGKGIMKQPWKESRHCMKSECRLFDR